jgi:LAS superfamily LD-carboxypeptidase LdcB
MMPTVLKKDIENTSSNTTTKKMNTNEETNPLTSLQRKPEEKENEDERFVDKIRNKIIEFINKKEPGRGSYNFDDDTVFDTAAAVSLLGVSLMVSAPLLAAAGVPLRVATDLGVGGGVMALISALIMALRTF